MSVVTAAAQGAIQSVINRHQPPYGLPLVCSCGVSTGDRGHAQHLAGHIVTALESLQLLRNEAP